MFHQKFSQLLHCKLIPYIYAKHEQAFECTYFTLLNFMWQWILRATLLLIQLKCEKQAIHNPIIMWTSKSIKSFVRCSNVCLVNHSAKSYQTQNSGRTHIVVKHCAHIKHEYLPIKFSARLKKWFQDYDRFYTFVIVVNRIYSVHWSWILTTFRRTADHLAYLKQNQINESAIYFICPKRAKQKRQNLRQQ